MKPIFFVILLFTSQLAAGQNYDCVQYGPKHYFNNTDGYLRGIRIDSMRSYPDSIVYFPFKSLRGNTNTSGGGGLPPLEFAGGSWLCEKIVKLPDGTFLFENIDHDTAIIKTQANVGDSWLFFRDSADIYYRAYVISKSTRLIYGTIDTVKIIQLKAFNRDTGYIPSNPINKLKITLSKSYGFYEAFDLYLFPHAFLVGNWDTIVHTFTNYFYRNCGPQQFKHVVVNSERDSDLYNYDIGDIIENTTYCTPLGGGRRIRRDTIISKTLISGSYWHYTTQRRTTNDCSPPSPPSASYGTSSLNGDTALLNFIDTSLMPEELGIQTMYFYKIDDTSICFGSPKYWWKTGVLFNEFEPCESRACYKMGLGNIYDYTCSNFGDVERHTYGGGMTFARKKNPNCPAGYPIPNNIHSNSGFSRALTVAPNPANSQLTVTNPTGSRIFTSLTDLLGRQVFASESDKVTTTINTSQFPAGLYIINIRDNDGNTTVQKISITH